VWNISFYLTKCDRLGVLDNKVLRKIAKGKVFFPTFDACSIRQWTVFLMLRRNLLLPLSVQMRKPAGKKNSYVGKSRTGQGS